MASCLHASHPGAAEIHVFTIAAAATVFAYGQACVCFAEGQASVSACLSQLLTADAIEDSCLLQVRRVPKDPVTESLDDNEHA